MSMEVTYLDTLVTHIVLSLLLPPSTLREILENIRRGIATYPCLAFPNGPNQDICSYYEPL